MMTIDELSTGVSEVTTSGSTTAITRKTITCVTCYKRRC